MCPNTAVAEPGHLHLMNKTNRELTFLSFTFSNKLIMACEVPLEVLIHFQLQPNYMVNGFHDEQVCEGQTLSKIEGGLGPVEAHFAQGQTKVTVQVPVDADGRHYLKEA